MSRDEQALVEAMAAERERLIALAEQQLAATCDAEDCVQEACACLLLRLHDGAHLTGPQEAAAALESVVVHEAELERRRAWRREHPGEGPAPAAA